MADRIRLTYAFDAYCGWCYGLVVPPGSLSGVDGLRLVELQRQVSMLVT